MRYSGVAGRPAPNAGRPAVEIKPASHTKFRTLPRALAKGEREGKMCAAAPYPGRLVATGLKLRDLASLIEPYLDRPVIDRTGIDAAFDIEIEGVEIKPPGPFGPSYRPSDTKRSIFELIESQLGLRLEPTTAAIDVIVVESAEPL